MVLIGKLQDGINKSKDNRITASKVYAELRRVKGAGSSSLMLNPQGPITANRRENQKGQPSSTMSWSS